MLRCPLRVLAVLGLLLGLPAPLAGQASSDTATSAVVAEVREAVRRYDDALRRADVSAVGEFYAPEYIFVNARGERLTRADRLANLRSRRTTLDSLVHAPREDYIRSYGEVVLYTTLLTLDGRYSGRAQRGNFRALVVWVRRDGRWQQIASQLTPITVP